MIALRDKAYEAWANADVGEKLSLALVLDGYAQGDFRTDPPANRPLPAESLVPGRPTRPELVDPFKVRQRNSASPQGRAALIHAIAHIEFNAVNLALDAVWRFDDMPVAYYRDWLKVAREEAEHFQLLRDHLRGLGHDYGDFPAHDGLWDMARRTVHDVMARMALVPRVLEARGLDASPPIRAKLAAAGDEAGARIIDILLAEEIGHVAIGSHWFRWTCELRGLDAEATFARLLAEHGAPPLKHLPNLAARRKAGFSESELVALLAPDVAERLSGS